MLNYLSLQWKLFKTKFFGEENGAVDLVVIVILIAIVVALALVFKDELVNLMSKIFGGVNTDLNEIQKKPNMSGK